MIVFIVVLSCLALNAVFSCAEMAFVTLDKKKLHKEAASGNRHARYLHEMQLCPERILSIVQVVITFVGIVSGAFSGIAVEEILGPWLMERFQLGPELASGMALFGVIVPLTFSSVVIGELVPKSIAIKYSFEISLIFSPMLRLLDKTLGFIVDPLENVTRFIVKRFLPKSGPKNPKIDNEISLNGLMADHKLYIKNLAGLDVKSVRSAMIPWERVEVIDSVATASEIDEYVTMKAHTRFPVLDSGEVYSYLHLKDFLLLQKSGGGENWLSYVRNIFYVPASLSLIGALKCMKDHKVQILVVGDSTRPEGIITLQDVIEEFLGVVTDDINEKKIVGFMRQRVVNRPHRGKKSDRFLT